MKRAKRLVALVTIASLTLATASVALAAEDATTTDEIVEEEVIDEEEVVEEEAAEEEVIEEAAPVAEQTYDDLAVTSKTFQNDRNESLGVYPVITGMDDLNKKIYDALFKFYDYYDNSTVDIDMLRGHNFAADYKVENHGRYAAIFVTYSFLDATDAVQPYDQEMSYFVDKEEKAEITKEVYEAATAEEEEPLVEETEEADEEEAAEVSLDAIMVPLRANAEMLGYELGYDAETKGIKIIKDDFITTIVTDVNSYTIDGKKVELDAAPTSQDGSVYVPISFFEKVLGFTASIDKDGDIIFMQDAE